jgi:PKHD-type hydroxylase
MILGYNYWYFISAIKPQICDQIIEYGLSKMYEQELKFGISSTDAITGDMKQKGGEALGGTPTSISGSKYTLAGLKKKGINFEDTYIRDSKVVFLDNNWLYELMWPFIREANKQAGWNFEWDFTEHFQFTKYGPDQFYGWHADAGLYPYKLIDENTTFLKNPDGSDKLDPGGNPMPSSMEYTDNPNQAGKIRKISTTLSLNDPSEYKGGNLRFDLGPHRNDERYHTCTEIRPQGSVIIFPSHIYHQVTPVTTGTRYSLVSWSLGPPWK